MTSHNNNNAELQQLRSEIDAVDDEIMALIKKRTGIVSKVGDLKSLEESRKCYIRPGREANMLRRIHDYFKDDAFSAQAACAIWRVIIAASTSVEKQLTLSVYNNGDDATLYWLAREYFGNFSPITRQTTATRVISDVLDGKASVGILPLPSNADTMQWWPSLVQKGKEWPRIFAHIPFMMEGRSARPVAALAIANIVPEETGDDITYLIVESDDSVSTSRLSTEFSKAGLEAQWINVHSPAPAVRQHLVTAKGFIGQDHPMLEQFTANMGGAVRVTTLGAYASPILHS
jgi:chorismate mutase